MSTKLNQIPTATVVTCVLYLLCQISCDERPQNSWPFQGTRLKALTHLYWSYKNRHHGDWPKTWDDLRNEATIHPAYAHCLYFVGPDDGVETKWLVFDPVRQNPSPGSQKVIGAAPRVGGNLGTRRFQRLVLFDNGVVDWMDEKKFMIQVGQTE
jgi:hypothetical protein